MGEEGRCCEIWGYRAPHTSKLWAVSETALSPHREDPRYRTRPEEVSAVGVTHAPLGETEERVGGRQSLQGLSY